MYATSILMPTTCHPVLVRSGEKLPRQSRVCETVYEVAPRRMCRSCGWGFIGVVSRACTPLRGAADASSPSCIERQESVCSKIYTTSASPHPSLGRLDGQMLCSSRLGWQLSCRCNRETRAEFRNLMALERRIPRVSVLATANYRSGGSQRPRELVGGARTESGIWALIPTACEITVKCGRSSAAAISYISLYECCKCT